MINEFESDYKNLVAEILIENEIIENRTGVRTLVDFNKHLTIDTRLGIPILTGRKIFFDKAYHEYRWIRDGLSTTKYLKDNDIHWWDAWADENGNLGKTYGYQLRNFNGEVDQLEHVHWELKQNSRRAHATFWNPSELNETKLPPCYTGITFMRVGHKLNMSMQLRSSDVMVGLPYDILVAYFFLIEVAEFNDLRPNKLGIQITNAHIYENHLQQANEYLNRPIHRRPSLFKDTEGHYFLTNYVHGEHIKMKLNI